MTICTCDGTRHPRRFDRCPPPRGARSAPAPDLQMLNDAGEWVKAPAQLLPGMTYIIRTRTRSTR